MRTTEDVKILNDNYDTILWWDITSIHVQKKYIFDYLEELDVMHRTTRHVFHY